MKTVSIHSHKGGAGKTTLGLCLAKLWAAEGMRTCVVDLDFVGSGIEGAIFLGRSPEMLVNDVLVHDAEPNLETLVGLYTDETIQDPPLGVILNAGRPLIAAEEDPRQPKKPNREEAVTAQSMSGIDGPFVDALERLLAELARAEYERCVLDCHPGLFEVSLGVFAAKYVDARVLVSTTDVSHFWGTIQEVNWDLLAKSELLEHGIRRTVLAINRADPERFPVFERICDEAGWDPRIGAGFDSIRLLRHF